MKTWLGIPTKWVSLWLCVQGKALPVGAGEEERKLLKGGCKPSVREKPRAGSESLGGSSPRYLSLSWQRASSSLSSSELGSVTGCSSSSFSFSSSSLRQGQEKSNAHRDKMEKQDKHYRQTGRWSKNTSSWLKWRGHTWSVRKRAESSEVRKFKYGVEMQWPSTGPISLSSWLAAAALPSPATWFRQLLALGSPPVWFSSCTQWVFTQWVFLVMPSLYRKHSPHLFTAPSLVRKHWRPGQFGANLHGRHVDFTCLSLILSACGSEGWSHTHFKGRQMVQMESIHVPPEINPGAFMDEEL